MTIETCETVTLPATAARCRSWLTLALPAGCDGLARVAATRSQRPEA